MFMRNSLFRSRVTGDGYRNSFQEALHSIIVLLTAHCLVSCKKLGTPPTKIISRSLAHTLMLFAEKHTISITLSMTADGHRQFRISLPCLFPDVDVFQHLSSARWDDLQRGRWYWSNTTGLVDSHIWLFPSFFSGMLVVLLSSLFYLFPEFIYLLLALSCSWN